MAIRHHADVYFFCAGTDVEDATNDICSSALAAHSETFTPQSYPTNICQQLASGASGNDTGGAAASSATPTGGSGAGSGSASSSSSSSTGGAAAAATALAGGRLGVVEFEGAVLGLAGVVMFALSRQVADWLGSFYRRIGNA